MKHKDEAHFLLNTGSLHNCRHIQNFIPTTYPKPRIHYNDHREARLVAATQLRDKKKQAEEDKKLKDLLKTMKLDIQTNQADKATTEEMESENNASQPSLQYQDIVTTAHGNTSCEL